MDTQVRTLLHKLASIKTLTAPAGEPGVVAPAALGGEALYLPILSVYLDWRPITVGVRPAERPARVILRDRLRDIQRSFWPRGAAFDAVGADASRIWRYLDEQAPASAQGLAIFACEPLGLFETLESNVPFEDEVTAGATPSLFPLARLMDDQETAVVTVMDTNTARMFLSQRGLLRELQGLDEDPKFFSMLKGANAMNQAHYQRYALTRRRRFAQEVAERIEQLVAENGATQVILAGDTVATPGLRAALSPQVARLVHEVPLHLDIDTPRDAIWDEIEPMIREMEAEEDRSIVERLVDATLANGLAVAGPEETRHALEAGQVDTLAISSGAQLPTGTRSQLISLAAETDAEVEIVDNAPAFEAMGGVGALLRYRYTPARGVYIPPSGQDIMPPGPPS
ncbi:MAG: host attachment protein, partial [Nitrososphaerota archaeon]